MTSSKTAAIVLFALFFQGLQTAFASTAYDGAGSPMSPTTGTAIPPPGGSPPYPSPGDTTGTSPPNPDGVKIVHDLVASTPSEPDSALIARNPVAVPYNPQPAVITNPAGKPVPSLTATKTIGRGGQVLLEDVNFMRHIAHFDREKIPDRVVHAKGSGAHGFFEVTNAIPHLTRASLFATVGKRTPVFVRLSSILHESGSADTIHDTRGFATKFYTDQGNVDLIGSNIHVFEIRDPILFPSLIRSRRRNPQTGLVDLNQFWDFTSNRRETTHHTLHLFSDLGFPASFRHMNGAAVHTFKLVNATGGVHFVRFHWRTNQGVRHITRHQAKKIAGENPDYYREDLFRAIKRGDFPSWNLTIQVMTPEQAAKYRWNVFDSTKLIFREDFPEIVVGTMVLNKNPENFFEEVEMLAVDPGNLPPGIEFSQDPVCQGRSFSYSNSQMYRLQTNFEQLPINKPLVPINTFDRDGHCIEENGEDHPNYFPNSEDGSFVSPIGNESVYHVNADVVRQDTRDDDNFSQPAIFLRSLRVDERRRLVDNLADSLVRVKVNIRERALANFRKVEVAFEEEIRKRVAEIQAQMPTSAEKDDDHEGHDGESY